MCPDPGGAGKLRYRQTVTSLFRAPSTTLGSRDALCLLSFLLMALLRSSVVTRAGAVDAVLLTKKVTNRTQHLRRLSSDTSITTMTTIPADTIKYLRSQVAEDPGLPRSNPTSSFWQLPPHDLSNVQSPTLPEITDYAIIGSGVTGCSIAKNLLDDSPYSDASITVFEARTLTSGATGRNGGALTSFVPYDFSVLREHAGHDQAVKIARFAHRTLEKMHQLGNAPGFGDASEARRLRDVVGFGDMESFRGCEESIQEYEKAVPDCSVHPALLSAEEAREKYNLKKAVGAMVFDCGAFWPYRLITKLWERILTEHKSRLSIETTTPVTSISYDPRSESQHPYVLSTPRGHVRATKVIHATNGYTGYLLPVLRGKIYPLRGTMSTQKSTDAFGQYGKERAWSFIHSGKFDPDTEVFETGLCKFPPKLDSDQRDRLGVNRLCLSRNCYRSHAF